MGEQSPRGIGDDYIPPPPKVMPTKVYIDVAGDTKGKFAIGLVRYYYETLASESTYLIDIGEDNPTHAELVAIHKAVKRARDKRWQAVIFCDNAQSVKYASGLRSYAKAHPLHELVQNIHQLLEKGKGQIIVAFAQNRISHANRRAHYLARRRIKGQEIQPYDEWLELRRANIKIEDDKKRE